MSTQSNNNVYFTIVLRYQRKYNPEASTIFSTW